MKDLSIIAFGASWKLVELVSLVQIEWALGQNQSVLGKAALWFVFFKGVLGCLVMRFSHV